MEDDDDEVAIDGGQEAATNDKGEPLEVAAGGPVSATIQVRKGTRPIADGVRKAFAASMEKIRARGGDGEDEGGMEPLEHAELPSEAAPVVKSEAEGVALGTESPAAAVQAALTAPAVAAPVPAIAAPAAVAPPTPPAPSLDPEVIRLREDFQKRSQELDAREAQIQAQHRSSDVAKLRETYYEKGAPAVAEMIKQWMPGLSEEELKDEMADLVQDLAHQFLGAPLEQTVKDRIATKRTRAGLKSWREQQEVEKQEYQKQLLATQEAENRVRVKRILHQEVTKPDNAPQYPYLASEANAGDLVFETIDQEYRTTGQQLTWVDAAKRVEDWLKSQALAFYDKRKHLLSPQPPLQQPPAPSDKQRTQGDNQVSRSQAPPKPPVPPAPLPKAVVVSEGKWTPERHREQVKSRHRSAFKTQYADDE